MWLIIPEYSLSAPELRALTSGYTDRLAAEQSVWWRGKPRAWKSWQRAWKRDPWTQRLFGRMPGPLTASLGVEQWISSLRDTPASPSVPPGSVKAQTTPGTSGPTSSGSSGKCVQGQLFSRTSKDTFDSDCLKSSKTSPNWGTMRSGVCSLRPKPELPTNGSGSSSWPTPTASLTNDGESVESFRARQERLKEKHNNGNGAGTPLTIAAKAWPTPTVTDASGSAYAYSGGDHTKIVLKLPGAAKAWNSPRDLTETGQECPKSATLRLNPLFVEWLMGFPEGWTACEPSGTPSAPHKPH